MTRLLLTVAFAALFPLSLISRQQPDRASEPLTEVASIRQCQDDMASRGGRRVGPTVGSRPGVLRLNCQTLLELTQLAYGELQGRILGIDGWMRSERWDVLARARIEASVRDMSTSMLREILEQRFMLHMHREVRTTRVYALAIAEGRASVLKSAAAADCVESTHPTPTPVRLLENGRAAAAPGYQLPCGFMLLGNTSAGTSVFQAAGATVAAIAKSLERELDRPVLDRTGLTVRLNVDFELAQTGSPSTLYVPAPSLFAALRETLGLQLRPSSGPATFMVIDAAARPSND